MEKKISLLKSEIMLTSDDAFSKNAIVLFLPGISGKAFSERFQPLVDVCNELKLPIARMDAWEGEVDVQTKTWSYFHGVLDEAIEYLLSLEYAEIVTIGKSFGGGLLLSYHNKNISKKILWAPAIGIGEVGTLTELKNTILSEVPLLLDIKLEKRFIHEDPATICIIHGTKDATIPIENSHKAIESAQNGKMLAIEDADHSFKTPEEEKNLMKATQSFLSGAL